MPFGKAVIALVCIRLKPWVGLPAPCLKHRPDEQEPDGTRRQLSLAHRRSSLTRQAVLFGLTQYSPRAHIKIEPVY
ncbi:MAG: hypothetical protein KatS3mg110_3282 [Pirellulaceae bacterium]|nr:MAG: hypothetical protein KatS3mg110_3282 [Pirellulaceae bacterium]